MTSTGRSYALDFDNAFHYPYGTKSMYVCICRAVTEREVESAIDAGATTVEAVTSACCAGDDCGACHGVIEDMIERRWGEHVAARRRLPLVGNRAA
jgi:bacterioferritin-associated ferredoxin